MSSSYGIYLVGFIILICGLAYGAYVAGVPAVWITVGVIILVGFAVLKTAKRMPKGSGPSTGGTPPRY